MPQKYSVGRVQFESKFETLLIAGCLQRCSWAAVLVLHTADTLLWLNIGKTGGMYNAALHWTSRRLHLQRRSLHRSKLPICCRAQQCLGLVTD